MVFSLLFSGIINMFMSRYISDCIYKENLEDALSAFYGGVVFCLILGGVIALVFISQLETNIVNKAILFLDFDMMLVIWLQMTLLSAIRKYKNIVVGFTVAVVLGIASTVGLMYIKVSLITAAFIGITVANMIIFIVFMIEIHKFYPRKQQLDILNMLPALDNKMDLVYIGVLTYVGMFGHNIVMWLGDNGTNVENNIRICFEYDIPSFYAVISIIPMLVMFAVSLETELYVATREYFGDVENGKKYREILGKYDKLKLTLNRELVKLVLIQAMVTIAATIIFTPLLRKTGMTGEEIGTYRMLCVGYFFYGLQTAVVTVLLYFDDRKGAFTIVSIFAACSLISTFITVMLGSKFYGTGFYLSAIVGCVISIIRLINYIKHFSYNVFCKQPIYMQTALGKFTRLYNKMGK